MAFREKAVCSGGKVEALLMVLACQNEVTTGSGTSYTGDHPASERCGQSKMLLGKVRSGEFEAP